MKKENDELLCKKYPKIFANRYGDKMVTAMCWGFEVGDGWFNLIHTLCETIQSYIDNNNVPQIVAAQVKEKYAGLRFYYDGGNEFIAGMVHYAEMLSTTICDHCGSPDGQVWNDGWMKTRCVEHRHTTNNS